jgi:hypothetical protein
MWFQAAKLLQNNERESLKDLEFNPLLRRTNLKGHVKMTIGTVKKFDKI